MRKLLLTFAGAALLVTGRPAAAAPARAEVEHALAGWERLFSADDARRLGPATAAVLISIADDPATRPLVRWRAIGALGFFDGGDVRAFLEREIAAAAGPRADLLGLATALGALARSAGDGAVGVVAPYLAHPNPDVRMDAARALAAAGPRGRAAVAARVATERHPSVLAAIRKALRARRP